MECCSPRFWCVADSYHSLNSELWAQYFYYMSCLYVTFPACVVHVLLALSMNLEPSTTESYYLHTCLYCVPRVSARGLICACVYLVSTCTKIGTPHEKALVQTEMSWLISFFKCSGKFQQCRSLIVTNHCKQPGKRLANDTVAGQTIINQLLYQ